MTARGVFCAVAVALVVGAPAARGRQNADDALIKKARAIHDKAITLDTHVDINPSGFTAERNYTQRLETQVNLPKMVEGGLDAVFLIVYVGQPSLQSTPDAFEPAGYERAYKAAIEKFDAVHRLTETIAPDKIGLALTAADVRRIAASGRKVALIGVENGYPLGTSISRVQEFYDRGATLHVARAQRPQPAFRLEHRRDRRLEVEGPVAARQAGHRRDEPRRHHDRRLASVEGSR